MNNNEIDKFLNSLHADPFIDKATKIVIILVCILLLMISNNVYHQQQTLFTKRFTFEELSVKKYCIP